VSDRRDAVAEDLRTLAADLKNLLDSATTDPKERQRKERRWTALYGALGIVTSLVARQVATKAWGILTGEHPPAKMPPGSSQQATQRREPESAAAPR
jgi:hypothetical protein